MKHVLKLIVVGLIAFAMAYSIGHYIRQNRRPVEPEIVKPEDAADLPDALVVYCFHGDKQTPRDKKIERQTHKLLEKSFAAELKGGKIVWRVLNYQKPENAKFAKMYNLGTTCIVLVDGRQGRWGDWKGFLPQTWELVDSDEEKFETFMTGEIRASLR